MSRPEMSRNEPCVNAKHSWNAERKKAPRRPRGAKNDIARAENAIWCAPHSNQFDSKHTFATSDIQSSVRRTIDTKPPTEEEFSHVRKAKRPESKLVGSRTKANHNKGKRLGQRGRPNVYIGRIPTPRHIAQMWTTGIGKSSEEILHEKTKIWTKWVLPAQRG